MTRKSIPASIFSAILSEEFSEWMQQQSDQLDRIERMLLAQNERAAYAAEYCTTEECMAILKISRKTFYNMIHKKCAIPYTTVGRKIMVRRDDLNVYLQSRGYKKENF